MSQTPESRPSQRGEAVTVAVQKLSGELVRLREGTIADSEFRPTRTILAVYGQRQPEQYMIRVRLPYGAVTPAQLRALAAVARTYGNGSGHITTRQDIQLHWLPLDTIPTILQQLGDAGLVTLQAGGNSVRNVAACPLAGVCREQAVDVTGYAAATDDYYVGNPDVQNLPRKFKSSFSGCAADCAMSAIQDFGAVATQQVQSGTARSGFRVYVGGGLGSMPRKAALLEDFVPTDEVLPTYHAVLRLFDRLGDRSRKDRARLKFVLSRLGIEEFRRLVREEREVLRQEALDFPVASPDGPTEAAEEGYALTAGDSGPQGEDYQRWLAWNVASQRQSGLCSIAVGLPLGDISSEQMEAIADLAEQNRGSDLRTSMEQNLHLRRVPASALPSVYDALRAVGLTTLRASGIADLTSCPGTSACSLAIAASKGLAHQLQGMLSEAGYQEDDVLGSLRVKVSGCPDSCSQHQLADIGFYGAALHQDDRMYPGFILHVGGKVDERGTRLGKVVMRLPSRKTPQALARLLGFYKAERRPDELFADFIDRVGIPAIRHLLDDLTHLPPFEEDPSNFIDWDATRYYILERGEGECSV